MKWKAGNAISKVHMNLAEFMKIIVLKIYEM
jgi:hypothetical protein